MKLVKGLIGALAVAGLPAFGSPAMAQMRHGGGGHGGGNWHGGGNNWHGHSGWHGHGTRFAFAVGFPFWGWGYPYGYGYYPYGYGYYAYPPPPPYGYAQGPVYNGRVVSHHSTHQDAKDVQSSDNY